MNDELRDERDLTLVLGEEEYCVTAEYFYTENFLYGADLDGRRGEVRQELYECQLLNAFKCLEDGTLEEVKDKEIWDKLTRLAEKEA